MRTCVWTRFEYLKQIVTCGMIFPNITSLYTLYYFQSINVEETKIIESKIGVVVVKKLNQ